MAFVCFVYDVEHAIFQLNHCVNGIKDTMDARKQHSINYSIIVTTATTTTTTVLTCCSAAILFPFRKMDFSRRLVSLWWIKSFNYTLLDLSINTYYVCKLTDANKLKLKKIPQNTHAHDPTDRSVEWSTSKSMWHSSNIFSTSSLFEYQFPHKHKVMCTMYSVRCIYTNFTLFYTNAMRCERNTIFPRKKPSLLSLVHCPEIFSSTFSIDMLIYRGYFIRFFSPYLTVNFPFENWSVSVRIKNTLLSNWTVVKGMKKEEQSWEQWHTISFHFISISVNISIFGIGSLGQQSTFGCCCFSLFFYFCLGLKLLSMHLYCVSLNGVQLFW